MQTAPAVLVLSDEIIIALHSLVANKHLELAGFHFYLSDYAPETRANAFLDALPLITYARNLGLDPPIIDIG
ncbi:hypothetical protein ARAF_1594 [Arsenophonus endosymbiont of Aleurodicus floccissimus]|uniref:hypothetical protein n=1 Tax=Arsenophonus endosymbiont of Aleurodicus floccissimus TaxID=2152761 RepID=UPI000ED92FDC|nr:hypothetical protein [Arsenophonus endosymbiont of Aleurodicus floccissimus]SPP31926.1 hypothetical protein ARAF_1594 [Arsenophonus endosymbiont of Aleurodicus floccissimus]